MKTTLLITGPGRRGIPAAAPAPAGRGAEAGGQAAVDADRGGDPGGDRGAGPLRASPGSASSGRGARWHRRWPAKLVTDPASRRGERDPQRIANDNKEQGSPVRQEHGRGAVWPVTTTGNGCWPASGIAAHPPHHVPVHWLPGDKDHRGENYCQRPHGKRDSRLDSWPRTRHTDRIGCADLPAGSRMHRSVSKVIADDCDRLPCRSGDSAAGWLVLQRRVFLPRFQLSPPGVGPVLSAVAGRLMQVRRSL